jgi:hypothetical protein
MAASQKACFVRALTVQIHLVLRVVNINVCVELHRVSNLLKSPRRLQLKTYV